MGKRVNDMTPEEHASEIARGRLYRAANRAEIREKERAWYERNRGRVLEKQRKYRHANHAHVLQLKRTHYQSSIAKNGRRQISAEKKLESCRRWRLNNRDRNNAQKNLWREANADRLSLERKVKNAELVWRTRFAWLMAGSAPSRGPSRGAILRILENL